MTIYQKCCPSGAHSKWVVCGTQNWLISCNFILNKIFIYSSKINLIYNLLCVHIPKFHFAGCNVAKTAGDQNSRL
jgi:hypothetical protein